MECVKQRDFEACPPFELTPSESGILSSRPGLCVASLAPGLGNRQVRNKDGQDPIADQFIQSHPEMFLTKVAEGFAAMGIKRSRSWVAKRRKELLSTDAEAGGVLAVHAINQTV